MYCPNCGTKNNPKSRFCKNCGYDLAKFRQKQKSAKNKANAKPVKPNATRQQAKHLRQSSSRQRPLRHRPVTPRPQRPRPDMQPQMMPPKKRHNKGLIISISIVVILAILVFGGIYAYSNNVFPFGNGPLSSLSQSSSNNSHVIKDVWQKVNNKLGSDSSNSGSDDYTSDFAGGTGSSAYHTVNGWTNLENKADANNDTKVASIKPYDIQNEGNGKYSYKVRYNFVIDSGSSDSYHHIQVFDWKSTIKNGKITSMNSPKTPEKDYKE